MKLPAIALPLPLNGPPPGYGWADRDMSTISSTTAFRTGLKNRDVFLGVIRCVVCGVESIRDCPVIMQSERSVWTNLKRRHWVPALSKDKPEHEPRNGLILCPNHHDAFVQYQFFIRYFHKFRIFVLVNYSGSRDLVKYHGRAIAIDIDDQHAPFPSLFIIHEMRVRGHNPFLPIQPNLPNEILWQDWIYSDDLLADWTNDNNALFKRDSPSDEDNENESGAGGGDDDDNENGGGADADADDDDSNEYDQPRRSGRVRNTRKRVTTAGTSSGTRKLEELNPGVIADILAATRAMPSWRACQIENTSWGGTTDENIHKYVSSIGVEESLSSDASERTKHPL